MISLFKVFMSDTVDRELLNVLHSGFIGQGKKVEEFERLLANYTGNQRCITVNSATSAIHLALRLCRVKGKEVISTPLTFPSTNTSIVLEGGKIVWADVDPLTGLVSPESIASKVTRDTAAIMIVDWMGMPCDVKSIYPAAKAIPIIEDAAQALGAEDSFGKLVGNGGSEFTAFSFQAIKIVTCGDGGALFTNNQVDWKLGKLLRWCGMDRESRKGRGDGNIHEAGDMYHMNDIAAVIAIENFRSLETLLEANRTLAEYYNKELALIDGIDPIIPTHECKPSYWLYGVRVSHRDDFMRYMNEKGVMCNLVDDRNDKHDCFKDFATQLPWMDEFDKVRCYIPCGWWVSESDREYIVQCIKEGW